MFRNATGILIAISAMLCVVAETAVAQWSTDAAVNDTVIVRAGQLQSEPTIVSDGEHGAVIMWTDNRNGNLDLWGGRIDFRGTLVWPEDGIQLVEAGGAQQSPVALAASDGNFHLAWQDDRMPSGTAIFLNRFDGSGSAVWEQEVQTHFGNNGAPSLLRNDNDELITASFFTVGFFFGISYQITEEVVDMGQLSGQPRYTPQQPLISDAGSGPQSAQPPALTYGLDGGVIASWLDTPSFGGDTLIFANGRLGDDNASEWDAGEVTIADVTDVTHPVIAPDGEQGAVIAWIDPSSQGQNDLVKASRLSSTGAFLWSDVLVNSTQGPKANLRIVQGADEFYLLWQNFNGVNTNLRLQRLDLTGNSLMNDVAIAESGSNQTGASVGVTANGDAVVVWQDDRDDGSDIYAQRIDSDGNLVWSTDGVVGALVSGRPGFQIKPKLTQDGLEGIIVAWEDSVAGNESNIFAQRINVNGDPGEFRTIEVMEPSDQMIWEIGSSQTISWSGSEDIDSVTVELSRNGGATFETIAPAKANSIGEQAYIVSGLPSTSCIVVVRAIDEFASHIVGSSEGFQIESASGPSLKLPGTVSESVAELPIEITAESSDPSGIQNVELHFKMGGAVDFDTTFMQLADSVTYIGEIPAESVGIRGVEYFVRSIDGIGNSRLSDTTLVRVLFPDSTISTSVALGNAQTAYRMVSVPNQLEETRAINILQEAGFGEIDSTLWRMFEYRFDSVYVELDSSTLDEFHFLPGRAYWLISARNRTLNFGAGASLATDVPDTLLLQPGWNQIANPFAFTVSWSAILLNSDVQLADVDGPHFYAGSYSRPDTLLPREGYFVENRTEQPVTLLIEPSEFVAPTRTINREAIANWKIEIEASCERASDNNNVIGIHPFARDGLDRYDHSEPPPIGEFVSVSFPGVDAPRFRKATLTTDFRADLGSGQAWRVDVRSNIANSEVTLNFRNVVSVPEAFEAVLLDERLNVVTDLRKQTTVSFPTGPAGVKKQFKLLVGPEAFSGSPDGIIPQDFELSQNFPNPFNPVTTIRYGVPVATRVTLRIYDLLGREVATLLQNEPKPAGFHLINWNGWDDRQISVASGVYIYRLSAPEFSQTRKMILLK